MTGELWKICKLNLAKVEITDLSRRTGGQRLSSLVYYFKGVVSPRNAVFWSLHDGWQALKKALSLPDYPMRLA